VPSVYARPYGAESRQLLCFGARQPAPHHAQTDTCLVRFGSTESQRYEVVFRFASYSRSSKRQECHVTTITD
jgi:hypothetical protein